MARTEPITEWQRGALACAPGRGHSQRGMAARRGGAVPGPASGLPVRLPCSTAWWRSCAPAWPPGSHSTRAHGGSRRRRSRRIGSIGPIGGDCHV